MGTNGIKKGNLGVHGAINVLLWYCQEIKGDTYEVSAFLLCLEVMAYDLRKFNRKAKAFCG